MLVIKVAFDNERVRESRCFPCGASRVQNLELNLTLLLANICRVLHYSFHDSQTHLWPRLDMRREFELGFWSQTQNPFVFFIWWSQVSVLGWIVAENYMRGYFARGEGDEWSRLEKGENEIFGLSSVGFYAPCAFNFTCFGAALQLLQQKLFWSCNTAPFLSPPSTPIWRHHQYNGCLVISWSP